MPVFLASLLGGFISIASSLVGRVLIALGITYITYSGLTVLLQSLQDQVWGNMSFISGEILNIMVYMKVDVALNIVISSVFTRLLLKGLTSDKLTKMVIK